MNREPHGPTRAKGARAIGAAGGQQSGRFQMPPKHPACGKRRCESKDQAIGYVLWLARKTTDPLRIYECPACGGWHCTKRPEWKDPT